MCILLLEYLLLIPEKMVKKDQLYSRIKILIKKIGDQNMLHAMTKTLHLDEPITHHSNRNPVAILIPIVMVLINLS